ncbi:MULTISPECIES: hypothetical protein [unclassified Rickettsia]|uniref:hypothetical protein n=1 Tax=unclassified Rickettsia TaxID=114295 RepID=UPI00313304E7
MSISDVIPVKTARCWMANNLPYYGYYKYGVIPWLDTETLCKNSSHATTPRFHGNDIDI